LDTLVLIPTFKEAENLKILIPQIMGISPNLDVLIVDDDSQDGTPILIKKLQLDYGKRIQLLTRKNNPSYADSFLEGIKFAIANGYECVIQMDADGSHPPMGILGLLNASGDLVIGSRYIKGSQVNLVPWKRRFYSIAGNIYISIRWRTSLRDKTNGFRLFRVKALNLLSNFETTTKGFAIQIEILNFIAKHDSITITEIPTTFNFRVIGNSKFKLKTLLEAFRSTNNVIKRY